VHGVAAKDECCHKNKIPKQRKPEQNENTARWRPHGIGCVIANQFRDQDRGESCRAEQEGLQPNDYVKAECADSSRRP
jgi:hypothetical protein